MKGFQIRPAHNCEQCINERLLCRKVLSTYIIYIYKRENEHFENIKLCTINSIGDKNAIEN